VDIPIQTEKLWFLLSIFEEEGPISKVFYPETIDESARLMIATKTISLLMGDSIYQNGDSIEGINYFGILPFPDLKLKSLTYFFLIADETARGRAKAATITVLIDEEQKTFFYENMKYLRVILDKTATKIQNVKNTNEYNQILNNFREEFTEFYNDVQTPFASKRKIKIIFSGLDRAGKSSLLLAIKKKYSEIIKALPTKGVERTEEKIFEEQNSQITIWDLGGQKRYLTKYLEQSEYYLYNVDLLFYLIDIQDSERISDSIELFKDIIKSIQELDEYPQIVVCFNKYDPDIRDSNEINKNLKDATIKIKEFSGKFFIKLFNTSIFDYYSLITAYSYGLSQLSPNREFFTNILKNFAEKMNADAILLINDHGIILSNYSKDEISSKVFEISAPHFQTLYKTFKEFKILKNDLIITTGINEDSKNIIFKRIIVDKYNLYLLLLIEKYQSIEKIEKLLPDFSNILTELISTYI
jgi:small GTP-binding protein